MASSSSQSGLNIDVRIKAEEVKAGKDMNFYLPLYKAAIRGIGKVRGGSLIVIQMQSQLRSPRIRRQSSM